MRLIVIVVVILVVKKWCLVPIRVTGHSMEPTFRDGRISVINLLIYRWQEPRRGDVVAVQEHDRRMILLKRVVGLPGERVLVRDGRTMVDGTLLDEPYARGHDMESMTNEFELGPGEYFVVGDNRDITAYGPVDLAEIKGKVLF